jgi:hypothetical protein
MRKMRGTSGNYRSYTRQSCNFVFPQINQRVNGEERPRPNKFRISEREANKLMEGKIDIKSKDKTSFMNVSQYTNAIELFMTSLKQYFEENDNKDVKNKHTIMDDVKIFLKKYNGDFDKFRKSNDKKSNLYNVMLKCSAKMVNIIFNIMNSKGPTIVYSNYVIMEGLQVFKLYLYMFGFYNYMDTKKIQNGKIGFVEFHGGIKDLKERYSGMKAFNNPDNKYGELIKIMLISPAGSEGLSLENVRQCHIMEPYWKEVRITQMIGRSVRFCSHKALAMDERHVDIYRYKSVRKNRGDSTADQIIESLARSKDALIQSFLDAIKEVAVDCQLFKNHNELMQKYKCFEFDEPSLFNEYVGPAYKKNIYDDMKYDSGLNNVNSVIVKIKVIEISAVIKLSSDNKISNVKKYWYYPESGTVYDYDLHYAFGKIAIDDDGNPVKLDKDTYIIDKLVQIPILNK